MTSEPAERLEALFALIVDEARANPELMRRMLSIVGVPVRFVGSDAVSAVDPIIEAGKGQDEFRKTFLTFELADLKKIIKEYELAETADLRGKKKPAVVELMWATADRKRRDMVPRH